MPIVIVPVLSSAKIVAFAIVSILLASLKSIPSFAAFEIPINVAIGVARPRAQGQAITITEIAIISDFSNPTPPI